MWAFLRGASVQRAVVEVAGKLNFLFPGDVERLLREVGEEIDDPEELVAQAIRAGHFVLLDHPREAYWCGEMILIDWHRLNILWEFVWELARRGKAGDPIDRMTFGCAAHENVVTNRKHRLSKTPGFPEDLLAEIRVVGQGTQQLRLPPEQIRIFEALAGEVPREWRP